MPQRKRMTDAQFLKSLGIAPARIQGRGWQPDYLEFFADIERLERTSKLMSERFARKC